MSESIESIWKVYKNGFDSNAILKSFKLFSCNALPKEVCLIISANNGQDMAKDGIFKLPEGRTFDQKIRWAKYKFISYKTIKAICKRIKDELPNCKNTDEIPFATINDLDELSSCLTINKKTLEISKVTFGFKPENYDLREISKFVPYRNKISNNMIDFLRTQILFNEMKEY